MATRHGDDGDHENWFDRSEPPLERELAFDRADEHLPWLESDDESDAPPPYDTGRLIGFGMIMLVALVVIVGGVWFLANRGMQTGPAPDGSLIAAPGTPYKVRPEQPGGKTFAGTGDTSYAVGAGKEVEARLAPATPNPVPAVAIAPTASPSATSSPTQNPASEGALPAGTAVQVGAYSNRADAEAGWQRLSGQTEALSGVSHRIVVGRADIGTVYRLQAVGGDRASAQALCGRLKSAGIACQVK